MEWYWIVIIVVCSVLLLWLLLSFVLTMTAVVRRGLSNTDNKVWEPLSKDPQAIEGFKENLKWCAANGECVQITSYDGLILKGKYYRKQGATKNIVLIHGYRGKPEVDFVWKLDYLKSKDFNILFIYNRASGLSEGEVITMGIKEQKDLHSWIDFLSKQNNLPIYLWGISMGASTVMFSFKEPMPDCVKGAIVDCGYTTIKDEYAYVINSVSHLHLGTILVFGMSLWCKLLFRININKPDTRKTINGTNIPILFVSGDKDGFVCSKNTISNYEKYQGPKSLLLIKGADHNEAFPVNSQEYISAIENLLKF